MRWYKLKSLGTRPGNSRSSRKHRDDRVSTRGLMLDSPG
jgi:hypothetical protein